jgi:hypothetical protein
MSETKCDPCTGLACGDECDGKSHATTKKGKKEASYGRLYDWLAPKLSDDERETLDNLLLCTRNTAAEEAACKERQRNTGERQYWELRNALKFRFQDQFEPALALMISNHDFARSHPCVLPCGEKTTPILTPESASDPASPRDVSEDVETISLALGSLALIPPEEELAIAAMHALDRIAGKEESDV